MLTPRLRPRLATIAAVTVAMWLACGSPAPDTTPPPTSAEELAAQVFERGEDTPAPDVDSRGAASAKPEDPAATSAAQTFARTEALLAADGLRVEASAGACLGRPGELRLTRYFEDRDLLRLTTVATADRVTTNTDYYLRDGRVVFVARSERTAGTDDRAAATVTRSFLDEAGVIVRQVRETSPSGDDAAHPTPPRVEEVDIAPGVGYDLPADFDAWRGGRVAC